MNEIVYINHCKAELTDLGKSLDKSKVLSNEFYTLNKRPTICKVTVNKTIIVDDVYVYHVDGEPICLYKDFEIIKLGFTSDDHLKRKLPWGWATVIPKKLVLEFKSDDFVITAVE